MMPTPIEDYALLSDCRTAALVARDGSIDWLCLPRYDSGSVFGALLGGDEQGCWKLRPTDPGARSVRSYDGDTFVLITSWETPDGGQAEVHDFMPVNQHHLDVVRRVDVIRRIVGVRGTVEFGHELRLRFDYARAVPWVHRHDSSDTLTAVAGPDAVVVRGAPLRATDHAHAGTFRVGAGEVRELTLTWHPSHHRAPFALDGSVERERTLDWWQTWADRIDAHHVHREMLVRSLLVLRALTHRDTGGIIAAPTTSLPEDFGGFRNWDYRYVWLRDAALTLEALIAHGFLRVVEHWRNWLLRAIAGDPAEMQIMYGVAGERDLPERELTHLPGYGGARPVRIGNGAALQYQADVVGEVMVALHAARVAGLGESITSWPLQRALLNRALIRVGEPDNGIWEIRGEPQLFTHSRAMNWAAFDRGVRAVREYGLPGQVELWESARDAVRDEIDANAVAAGGWFTQYYGTDEVDASLLVLPAIGFCEPDDPRMLATVDRIERTLVVDGLLHRYRAETGVDGLAGTEHPFLACSFWLVEQYARTGRLDDAEALLDRLCGVANDLGLLSEEYDVHRHRQAGNMPQAFSHLALVRAADALAAARARGAAGDHGHETS